MKKLSRRLSSHLMSTVIVGALCFSVGEGLRLTPFPVPTVPPTHGQNEGLHLSAGNEIALSQYGPLTVPTQNQKRSKRQMLHAAGPAIAGTYYAAPERSLSLDFESVNFVSLLSVTRPPGRAPPFRA